MENHTTIQTYGGRPVGTLGPGLHQIPMADYHRDPCPIPSASCSILETLLDKTPHHAWLQHPRLNQDGWKPSESSRKADIGSAVHEMATRRGRGIVTIEANDYRTRAAQEARDAARAAGRTPILLGDRERAAVILQSLRKRVREHPDTRGAFRDGRGEVTMIAQMGPGLYGRAMVDWIQDHTLWDLKTTASDIGDEALRRRIGTDNLDMRAAWYLHLASTLHAEERSQWRYVYAFIETSEPYECRFIELTGPQLDEGEEKMIWALDVWKNCLLDGSWPGYPAGIEKLEAAPWASQQWQVRQWTEADRRQQGMGVLDGRARGHKDRRGLRIPEFGPTS